MKTPTYYDTLRITRDADFEMVDAAFRVLAKTCHPDKFPGDLAKEQQFKAINEARQVLSDPKKRGMYDISLDNQPIQFPSQATRGAAPAPGAYPDAYNMNPFGLVDQDIVGQALNQAAGVFASTLISSLPPAVQTIVRQAMQKQARGKKGA